MAKRLRVKNKIRKRDMEALNKKRIAPFPHKVSKARSKDSKLRKANHG
ncbi:MAG TPA: hypothetical protein VL588_11650 [Bdellovibrionota bacterium]|nr:hypothetical protein [Bdellovibrionota bacterium]